MQAVASERNQQCQCRSGFYRTSTSAVAGVVTCGTAEASFDCTSCQPCVLHSTYEPLNADGSSTCTSSTDRTCRPVLDQCSPEALYFEPTTGAPTPTSDRVCADKRTQYLQKNVAKPNDLMVFQQDKFSMLHQNRWNIPFLPPQVHQPKHDLLYLFFYLL